MSQVLDPLVVECDCGKVVRIANSWTAFRCSHCRKVLGYGPAEKRTNNDDFSNENAGIMQGVSV